MSHLQATHGALDGPLYVFRRHIGLSSLLQYQPKAEVGCRVTATLGGLEPVRLRLGIAVRPVPALTLIGFGWASLGTYASLGYSETDADGAARSTSPISFPETENHR